MPLKTTLEAINALANNGAKSPLATLWLQLRFDFFAENPRSMDDKASKFAFQQWALDNVHPRVMAWATDETYVNDNHTLKQDILRRWNPTVKHLQTSPGVVVFLFGTDVINSRKCADVLSALCRTNPTLTLGTLFAQFVQEQRQESDRRRSRSPKFSFKSAIDSFSPEDPRERPQTRNHVQTGAGPSAGGDNADDTGRLRQTNSEPPERARKEQQQYAQSETSDLFSVGSAIDEYDDLELAPGDSDGLDDDNFYLPVDDSDEKAKGEKPAGVALLPPSPLSRRDLSTIEEEPASPCHMGDHVLVTRGTFSRRKRSLSMSEVLEASDHQDSFAPPPKSARRRQHTVSWHPAATHTPPGPTQAGAGIDEIMDSMYRLNDGNFLNDVIINRMAHRLGSEDVGVIDSLTIASESRTPRFRTQIQTTMSRGRVLIFVNHNLHWILYIWRPAECRLQEFDSMPQPEGKFAGCCDTVADFIKWAHGNPAMAITLERPECAKQDNGWDCRVFTIRFAKCLSRSRAIPHAIDGSLERKCLMNAILVTWAGALHPEEISNIGCPLATSPTDKRRQFLNYFQRKRSFRQLLSAGGSEYATTDAFTTNLRQMAKSEENAIQKSVLASTIDSIHVVYRNLLESALDAEAEARALLEKSRRWTDTKSKLDDLLLALAETGSPKDLAALPAPDQSRHRNLEIIRHAGQNLQNDWDLCQGDEQSVREAREQAEERFGMTRAHLLVLYHAVGKFRKHAAHSGTA